MAILRNAMTISQIITGVVVSVEQSGLIVIRKHSFKGNLVFMNN